MVISQSIKACAIALPLLVTACGGGGGEPGVAPQAGASADTRLHPESYVERWWPECGEGKPCPTPR